MKDTLKKAMSVAINMDKANLPNEETWQSLEDFVKKAENPDLTLRLSQFQDILVAVPKTLGQQITDQVELKARGQLKDLSDTEAMAVVQDALSWGIKQVEGNIP